jgi:hypothetical protein
MSTIPAALHTIGDFLATHAAILALRGVIIGSTIAVTGVLQLVGWLVVGALATVLITEQRRALTSMQLSAWLRALPRHVIPWPHRCAADCASAWAWDPESGPSPG